MRGSVQLTQLTPNFTLEEMTHSDEAMTLKIENVCPPELLQAMRFTALGMERIRAALLGLGVEVLSGYRSYALNLAVKGSVNSQHMKGEACDFICPRFGQPFDVARRLSSNCRVLGIDQLILEKTWVHVSFSWDPRHEVLTIKNGITIKGLV